jgi:succinoglycan biosynthesis protein ExoA
MPRVSIIVPCYNERSTIRLLLEALYAQTYPRNEMEVIIADGMSTDNTLEQIAAFQVDCSDLVVKVVTNERRTIPAGLNRAIQSAQGEYIIRLDAHSMPRSDYVTTCVADLEQGAGDIVGGVWDIQPGGSGWIARAIAASACHPLGVGDARYRYGGNAGAVDTVPFGAYRRNLIDRIGPYDEVLLTNEDYEYNTRVRKSNGTVWLDPAIRSIYFARPTFQALARQYWRYGYWKARMLRRYPNTLRWRQALPPLFVLGLLILCGLALITPLARSLLLILLSVYLFVLVVAGVQLAIKKKDFSIVLGFPIAIAIMHIAWGSAFLWSFVS